MSWIGPAQIVDAEVVNCHQTAVMRPFHFKFAHR